VKRRRFLHTCAAGGAAAGTAAIESMLTRAWAQGTAASREYPPARLVDLHGTPLKARDLATNRNYVFNFPYAGTPCFLLSLDRALTAKAELSTERGGKYQWPGGVGPRRSIVAYSAICAHKLAYPAKEVSFIRFQEHPSKTSKGGVIHCCAEHSVYDPADGARVLGGPAPQPLAAIVLAYDAKSDGLSATGTIGAEQFDAFFAKYDFKLTMEHGPGKARAPVGSSTVCKDLAQYCRQTVQC
jgi:arsenite oxidase small subunit